MTKILAIDPGPTQSAVVLWDSAAEQILAARKMPNEDLLVALKKGKGDLTPDFCVIERISSYGMAVGEEVFETVFWTGKFAEAWDNAMHPARLEDEHAFHYVFHPAERLKRGEIKMHLCHSMKAKDSNIRQALIDRLGKPGTKKNPGKTFGIAGDMWQALAVGITFAETKLGDTKGAK